MRYRRNMTPWLIALAALIGIGLLSGAAQPVVAVTLIALFVAALAFSLSGPGIGAGRLSQPRAALTSARASQDAREATARARRTGTVINPDMTMMDVGLIALQSDEGDMSMRRTRTVSLDDDGVRPFLTLNVTPAGADRRVIVRFEMRDGMGKIRYVHEMRPYLRAGEMNLLADHQLPLEGNEPAVEPGDWDLRVFVDGLLMGEHIFTVMPSIANRFRQSGAEPRSQAARTSRLVDADAAPMSLEDLLRGNVDSSAQDQSRRS